MYLCSFVFAMLTPVTMLAVGLWWRIAPPAFQSKGLAYHTALTAKSPEVWTFAHRHCSRLWIRIGLILAVLTAVLMSVFRESYRAFLLWLICGQMAFLCISVFLVETLLKNTFDSDGRPIL